MLTEDGEVEHRPGSRLRRWLDIEQEAYLRSYVGGSLPTTTEAIEFVTESWSVTYSISGMRAVLRRIGAYLDGGRWRADIPRPAPGKRREKGVKYEIKPPAGPDDDD
jgi:transposase